MAFCSGESRPPEIRFISTHKVPLRDKKIWYASNHALCLQSLGHSDCSLLSIGYRKDQHVWILNPKPIDKPTCSECSEGDVFEAEISVTAETLRLRLMFFLHLRVIELHDLLIARVMVGWLHLDLARLPRSGIRLKPHLCCWHQRSATPYALLVSAGSAYPP